MALHGFGSRSLPDQWLKMTQTHPYHSWFTIDLHRFVGGMHSPLRTDGHGLCHAWFDWIGNKNSDSSVSSCASNLSGNSELTTTAQAQYGIVLSQIISTPQPCHSFNVEVVKWCVTSCRTMDYWQFSWGTCLAICIRFWFAWLAEGSYQRASFFPWYS